MLYQVINLENVGNDKDGYEVNDAHFTGQTIELSDSPQVADVLKAMKECGVMRSFVNRNHITCDFTGDSIFIQARSGMWLWELRPKR